MTEQLKLAKHVASILGLPPTWPNLRTIEIALICETAFSSIPLAEAADVLISCARDFRVTEPRLLRYFPINRFFFEDAIWRETTPYFLRQMLKEGEEEKREAEKLLREQEEWRVNVYERTRRPACQ